MRLNPRQRLYRTLPHIGGLHFAFQVRAIPTMDSHTRSHVRRSDTKVHARTRVTKMHPLTQVREQLTSALSSFDTRRARTRTVHFGSRFRAGVQGADAAAHGDGETADRDQLDARPDLLHLSRAGRSHPRSAQATTYE